MDHMAPGTHVPSINVYNNSPWTTWQLDTESNGFSKEWKNPMMRWRGRQSATAPIRVVIAILVFVLIDIYSTGRNTNKGHSKNCSFKWDEI